jgi:hypothetical protein
MSKPPRKSLRKLEVPTLEEVQLGWWWRNSWLIPLGILDMEGREANKRRMPTTFQPWAIEKWSAIAYDRAP